MCSDVLCIGCQCMINASLIWWLHLLVRNSQHCNCVVNWAGNHIHISLKCRKWNVKLQVELQPFLCWHNSYNYAALTEIHIFYQSGQNQVRWNMLEKLVNLKNDTETTACRLFFHILLFPQFSSSIVFFMFLFLFFFLHKNRLLYTDIEAGQMVEGRRRNKNHTKWFLLKHN